MWYDSSKSNQTALVPFFRMWHDTAVTGDPHSLSLLSVSPTKSNLSRVFKSLNARTNHVGSRRFPYAVLLSLVQQKDVLLGLELMCCTAGYSVRLCLCKCRLVSSSACRSDSISDYRLRPAYIFASRLTCRS